MKKQRARGSVFVAHADGTFTCDGCTPKGVDLGDESVQTWRWFTHGWTGPVVCRECKLSIPVFCDGNEGVSPLGDF